VTQLAFACAIVLREEVIGVERVITASIEEAAVELVLAGTGGDADDGTRGLTILCAERVADLFLF